MRVGVFFQANAEQNVKALLSKLKENSIQGSAYKLGPSWESLDGGEIHFNFSSLTHFMLMPSSESFKSRWLPFLSGFAMGGTRSLVVFSSDTKIEKPSYLNTGNYFSDMNEVIQFLKDEEEIWSKTHKIELAREYLISLGIGINEANMAQRTANGDFDAVLNFLHIGYSPDTMDQGAHILIIATRNGHKQIVDLLLEHGADVNAISTDRGNTALMEASVKGDEHSVKLFLEAGANPDLQNKSGQTALMLAVGEGHKDVSREIIKYRPNIDIKDQLGMTAKKYAELFKHEEITLIFEEYLANKSL